MSCTDGAMSLRGWLSTTLQAVPPQRVPRGAVSALCRRFWENPEGSAWLASQGTSEEGPGLPRSVVHDVNGGELRVWRTSDGWLHLKLNAVREHGGSRYDIEARWDVPPAAEPWSGRAARARDGDDEAVAEVAATMCAEAIADA